MYVSPEDAYEQIFRLLETHHGWFSKSIPLIASENVPSAAVREALISDFGNRYAEGWPGERVYAGCVYIDQVELLCMELAKKLFRAEFADVRPISGVNANLAVYSAFTEPSDRMMALSIPNGGHITTGRKEFSGTAGLVHGLKVEYFPFDREEMNIDVDKTKQKVEQLVKTEGPIKLAMFGGSLFLFPHPVAELSDYFHDRGIFVCHDAAHVSGLIAGQQFQDPLREGVDAMTLSTHKTLFGPQGGVVLSFERYGEAIKKAVFPGNTSNHHLHSVAAKAVAFAEMLRFGEEYARQVVSNAQALAQALHERGFHILGEKKGFTRSHQVAIDISDRGDGGTLEKDLERANIIVNRQLLPGDIQAGRHYMHPGGLRLGTQEVTRLGMRETEMVQISEFIKQVIVDRKPSENIRRDVEDFRSEFQRIHFAFESSRAAHEYISIR